MAGTKRGGQWVVAQIPLLVLAAIAPRIGPPWPRGIAAPARVGGSLLVLAGAYFLLRGFRDLGRNLTPFPRPKEDGQLVRDGIYGVVRHPIYTGLIGASWGWALVSLNTTRLLVALALALFFDAKARREEVWLGERYADYADYQSQVNKLIPRVY